MRKKLFFILLVIVTLKNYSQNFNVNDSLLAVTNYIEERINVKLGTSVIVTQNNNTLYTNSNGLSSLEAGTKNDINTLYDLASIGKMFTGYAIAFLETNGQLNINDEIQKYLPNFPRYKHKITIAQLVHHTSGIKNWTYLIQQDGWDFEDRITTELMLRLIYAQNSLDFVPGSKYQYSNSGYVLLSKIIENITKKPFEEWMRDNVFIPLKMNDTFFNTSTHKVINNFASAYRLDNEGKRIREAYNTSVLGSSSLISNVIDMGKWMNFLLYPPKNKKAVIQKMLTPKTLNDGTENNYAYGVEISKHNGVKVIGHDGSWASYTSNLTIIPSLKTGVFFANNYRTFTGPIMDLYLDVFIPIKKKKSQSNKRQSIKEKRNVAYNISQKKLNQFVGRYKLGKAWYLDITKENGKLYTKSTGERKFYMKPLNDSTFLVRQYGNRTITFDNNSKKATYLIYNNKNSKRKTEDFYFNEEEFKIYEGVYYSKELGIVYEFFITDNKLFYSSIKSGTFVLNNEEKDFFFTDGKLSKIEFIRDKSNSVTGFYKVNSKGKKLFFYNKAR